MPIQVPSYAADFTESGKVKLNEDIYGKEFREDLIQRTVRYQLAQRQAGTHKVKERGEIARTGSKAYRQKGTGSARHGSRRANIFRGGGVVHGPRVRTHNLNLPKKVRQLALKTALSFKVQDKKFAILAGAADVSAKTKDVASKISALECKSVLVVATRPETESLKSVRNVKNVDTLCVEGLNVYDLVRKDLVLVTEDASKAIEERFAS